MTDNCFPKCNRLLSVEDFSYLRKDSKRIKGRNFIIYYKDSLVGVGLTRIGISVSKKVGNAVFRNTYKRLIREFFRTSEFKNLGLDILIVLYPYLKQKNINDSEFRRIFIKDLSFNFKKLVKEN